GSASRLCGRVRVCAGALAVSGAIAKCDEGSSNYGQNKNRRKEERELPFFRSPAKRGWAYALLFFNDREFQLRRHVAMQLDRHVRLAERANRIRQQDLAAIDVEALLFQKIRDVGVGHRSVERVVV